MAMRRKHPFMGKAPIQRLLERQGLRLSVSTVGRVLSCAIADGAVPPASLCEGRAKPKRPGQLVQIDGGSEFMAGFEDACRKLGVTLRVLPPRRPQWNGCVERANRIEFRNLLDCNLTVEAVSKRLLKHEFFHNHQRPHSAIDCRSPNDCLVAHEAAQPQCQMS